MLPPLHDIKAVQKIVYDPARAKKLEDLLCEISTIMNLLKTPCSGVSFPNQGPNVGKGPTWYLLQGATLYTSGQVVLNPAVQQAADRCDRVATVILEIHDAIAHVNIPTSAKTSIRIGLSELAMSWQARGKMWRDPDPDATNGAAHVQAISTRFKASMKAFERVRYYL